MGTIYDPHCWNPRSPPTVRTATGHGNCTTTLSLEVHFIEAGMVYSVAACGLYLNKLAQRWLVALRHLLSQLLFFPKKKMCHVTRQQRSIYTFTQVNIVHRKTRT